MLVRSASARQFHLDSMFAWHINYHDFGPSPLLPHVDRTSLLAAQRLSCSKVEAGFDCAGGLEYPRAIGGASD